MYIQYIHICAIPLRNLLRDRQSSDRRQDLIRRLFVRLRNKDVRQVDLGSDLCPAMPFSLDLNPIRHAQKGSHNSWDNWDITIASCIFGGVGSPTIIYNYDGDKL